MAQINPWAPGSATAGTLCYRSRVLGLRVRRSLPLLFLAVIGAGFPSCSKSSPSDSGDDGGSGDDVVDLDDQTILGDDSAVACDPCETVCPCTPGDYFYNPAICANETCGKNGLWGGVGCMGHGCPEAADEDDGDDGDDEGSDGPTGDGSVDASGDATTREGGLPESGADATSDAPGEASPAFEGGVDAGPG